MVRHELCAMGEISEGTGKRFVIDGKPIGLFLTEGNYYAIRDECTHVAASLVDGTVVGKNIHCPLHGAKFDLETGKVLSPPARRDVECFKVIIEGGKIFVELS